ncbi:MAG TPA: hemerythrin family protein [Clostridia bacterium]|nr:hemerythrin family protein [Clostridia bacterium]
MAITWKDDLSIGVPQIDNQHKELIKRIDGLFEACNKGQGKAEVMKVTDYLGQYVVTHFSDEEALQKKYGYPDYNNHKQLHTQFIKDFETLKDSMDRDGVSPALVIKLNKLLIDWLLNHIKKADRALGDYIKNKN